MSTLNVEREMNVPVPLLETRLNPADGSTISETGRT